MRYLVTGGTGFLGPFLIKKLVSGGHLCRCLVRPTGNRKTIQGPGVEIVEGDVTIPEGLKGIAEGMDRVVHMATLGHMSNSLASQPMFDKVNVKGTVNIMREAARAGVDRFIHCSSVAAMGICPDIPATEESRCMPHNPYGRSKLKAEKEVLRMVSETGLHAVIVRFSMVYGPGDPRDILRLTRLAKRGLFPRIGSRSKLTPLIHMDDAIQGLLLAMERGRAGQVYLLTNRQSEPFDNIRKVIQEALGGTRISLYVPEKAVFLAVYLLEKACSMAGRTPSITRKNIESVLADRAFSIEKAEKELGFDPGVEPASGLKDTVLWYKKQGWV